MAVVGVVHLNKRESRFATDRINGSVAFYNAARGVLLLTKAGDDDIRLLTHPKSNLAKPAVTLRYRIEGADVWADGRLIKTSRAVLVGEAPEVAPDQGLATLAGPKTGPRWAKPAVSSKRNSPKVPSRAHTASWPRAGPHSAASDLATRSR